MSKQANVNTITAGVRQASKHVTESVRSCESTAAAVRKMTQSLIDAGITHQTAFSSKKDIVVLPDGEARQCDIKKTLDQSIVDGINPSSAVTCSEKIGFEITAPQMKTAFKTAKKERTKEQQLACDWINTWIGAYRTQIKTALKGALQTDNGEPESAEAKALRQFKERHVNVQKALATHNKQLAAFKLRETKRSPKATKERNAKIANMEKALTDAAALIASYDALVADLTS